MIQYKKPLMRTRVVSLEHKVWEQTNIQRQIRIRMEWENMKRMVMTSFVLVVLFSVAWLNAILDYRGQYPTWIMGVGLVACLLWQIGFGAFGYWWMGQKQGRKAELVLLNYWIGTGTCFITCILMSDSTIKSMLYLFLFILSIAVIPVISVRAYLASLVCETILSLVLWYRGILDFEHWIYTVAVCVLCAIISRQQYSSYMRKYEDRCRMSNIQNQAETDSMTRLLNRRGLERRIATVWPMCVRQGVSVSVIMLDIDNFKKYNDTFGHGKGDLCIQAVSRKLMEHTQRKTDYAARVGGEEFLVFLPGISKDDTVKWARKCKESIESLGIKQANDNFLPYVSVSIGICHINLKEQVEFWELQNEADRCLYLSKANGRASIFMEDKCFGQTKGAYDKRQYNLEKGFRSLG